MGSSWAHSVVGTGSTDYATTRLPEVCLRMLVNLFGGDDPFAQRSYLTLIVVACVIAVGYLAVGFTSSSKAPAVAGAVAVFNPFTLTQLPNTLPFIAIAAVAVVSGVAVRISKGSTRHRFPAVVLALFGAALSRNPPLLVVVGLTAVAAVVVVVVRGRKFLVNAANFCLWAICASLFWTVPLVIHFVSGTPGLSVVATTDIDAWSWSHHGSTFFNVIRLEGTWVWADKEMLPATVHLATLPWAVASWGLPFGALLAVIAVRQKIAYFLGSVILVLCVLGSGLNEPFSGFNKFLYAKFPGYYLFRQPLTKFGVLIVVAYAVLFALGVARFEHAFRTSRNSRLGLIPAFGGGVLGSCLVAGIVFAHPLYLGTLTPGTRVSLPAVRVVVPDSFRKAGEWLNDAQVEGGVLTLPLTDFYMRGTKWGYYGGDDLLALATVRPVLSNMPCCGYYEAAGTAPELMHVAEMALLHGDDSALRSALRSLGVAYVVVRTDFDNYSMDRQYTDPTVLLKAANNTPTLAPATAFDDIHIFALAPGPAGDNSSPVFVEAGLPTADLAELAVQTGGGRVVVGPDAVTKVWRAGESGASTFTGAAGTYVALGRWQTPPVWDLSVSAGASTYKVVAKVAATWSIDGANVFSTPETSVELSSKPVGVFVGDHFVPFINGKASVEVGATVYVALEGAPIRLGASDVVENAVCPGGQTAAMVAASDSPGWVLPSSSEPSCGVFELSPLLVSQTSTVWDLSGSFVSNGAPGSACLWMAVGGGCERVKTSVAGSETTFGSIIDTSGVAGAGVRLVVSAEPRDVPDEVVLGPIQISQVVSSPTVLNLTVPDISSQEIYLTSKTHTLQANTQLLKRALGPLVGVSDTCAASSASGAVRLLNHEPGVALELSAVNGSACAPFDLQSSSGIRHLTLSFEHRTLSGNPGRWCVTRQDTFGCVATEQLASSASWKAETFQFDVPSDLSARGTAASQLLLYAVGSGPGKESTVRSTVQFRNVSVSDAYPLVGVLYRKPGPTSSALTVLHEAFADGWTKSDGTSHAVHVLVDGWANGWLTDLSATSLRVPVFTYSYDRYVFVALLALPFTCLLAMCSALRGWRNKKV